MSKTETVRRTCRPRIKNVKINYTYLKMFEVHPYNLYKLTTASNDLCCACTEHTHTRTVDAFLFHSFFTCGTCLYSKLTCRKIVCLTITLSFNRVQFEFVLFHSLPIYILPRAINADSTNDHLPYKLRKLARAFGLFYFTFLLCAHN